MFPGNEIPYWFNHLKEDIDNNSCEIYINNNEHVDLDGEFTGIAFSAVIAYTSDVEDEETKAYISETMEDNLVSIEVTFSNGNKIYTIPEAEIRLPFDSDHVWFQYVVPKPFELKGDNILVEFKLMSKSVFFKSCGFHLVHSCGL
jgi:hypothetical protein